jgi:HAD superfamily hydrolase (TIGR01509 family)
MPIALHIPIDAVICDMDGLLIDSEGLSTEAWRVTLAGYGVMLQASDFDDMFGLRIDEDAELIIQRYHVAATVPELVQGKSDHMLALVRGHLQPMPGARDLVVWLMAQEVPHALATSGLGEYAATCLAAVGLGDAFAIRVTGEQVPHGKPAPDIFLEAARRLDLSPERCLVLEDAPNGVAAAVAAGMPVIAVPNAHTAALTFPPVTARVASLHEVLEMLHIGS